MKRYGSAQEWELGTKACRPSSAWRLLPAACMLLASATLAAPEEPVLQGGPRPVFSGSLRAEYDYRGEGSASDSDLYGYAYGEGRDLANGYVDIYSSLRLHSDLDSSSSSSVADDPFLSVSDTDDVTETRLLQLYLDGHDLRQRVHFRLGRQYVDVADFLLLDGGQAILFEDEKLGGRLYFGAPVRFYSSDSDGFAGGVSLVGQPWSGNRSRFTYASYDNGDGGSDANYFADVRQDVTDQARMRGQMSVLNGDFRMGRMDASCTSEDGQTDLSVGGSRWGEFDAETIEYSPLYGVLGKQAPYTHAYARFSQVLHPTLMVSPGVSARFADDDGNAFGNRDYRDYDLTLTYEPVKAINASVSLEYWDTDDGDDFTSLAGELRYRRGRVWEVSTGAGYVQYTYDTYSDISYSINGGQTYFSADGTVTEKTPDVFTYFVRGRWRVTPLCTLRLQGDAEDQKDAEDVAFRGRGSVEVRY